MDPLDVKQQYNRLIAELRKTLVNCGIPENVIAIEVVLRRQNGYRQDADLIILGEDGKTIVAQFDVRIGHDAFCKARRYLQNMSRHHKCYAVTIDGKEGLISSIDESAEPHWIKFSDLNGVKRLLGNYIIESTVAVAAAEEKKLETASKEWTSFRFIVGIVGVILVVVAATLEWMEHEFSWKVYSLLFLVMAMFAAASGYVIHIKVGENEIDIEKKKRDIVRNPKSKESADSQHLPRSLTRNLYPKKSTYDIK